MARASAEEEMLDSAFAVKPTSTPLLSDQGDRGARRPDQVKYHAGLSRAVEGSISPALFLGTGLNPKRIDLCASDPPSRRIFPGTDSRIYFCIRCHITLTATASDALWTGLPMLLNSNWGCFSWTSSEKFNQRRRGCPDHPHLRTLMVRASGPVASAATGVIFSCRTAVSC